MKTISKEIIDSILRKVYRIQDPNHPDKIITLDDTQIEAVRYALQGRSFNIVGAAGTGKSTVYQAILLGLIYLDQKLQEIDSNNSLLRTTRYKIVGKTGAYNYNNSIAVCSFTNKAVNNVRNKIRSHPILHDQFEYNITTLHNLLEFQPCMVWSEKQQRDVQQFLPTRTKFSPLTITHLFIDEGSMVGVGNQQIWDRVYDALPEDLGGLLTKTQLIVAGDINQLPPVGGKPLLAYSLRDLPTIELTTIHRQALDSPIISSAYKILKGEMIESEINTETGDLVKVIKLDNKKKIPVQVIKNSLASETGIARWIRDGLYTPGEDIILCPFNKDVSKSGQILLGTKYINSVVANYLHKIAKEHYAKLPDYKKREPSEIDKINIVEVLTAWSALYIRVGERVLVDKQEGIITSIKRNKRYLGKIPADPSPDLNYFGHKTRATDKYNYEELDIDSLLEVNLTEKDTGATSQQASHITTILLDTGETVICSSTGDYQETVFSLAYSISVHKAQGSEWNNVFILLHDCHKMFLYRELLYTAATRARHKVFWIAQEHVIRRGIENTRIQGSSLKAKIASFNEDTGKYLNAPISWGKIR